MYLDETGIYLCGVYAIVCVDTGQYYVGQSRDIASRWASHLHQLRKGKHSNFKLLEAWKAYGEENFAFIILELCSEESLGQRELDEISRAGALAFNLTEQELRRRSAWKKTARYERNTKRLLAKSSAQQIQKPQESNSGPKLSLLLLPRS